MFRNYYRLYNSNYIPYSKDYGPEPFATNIKEVTMKNENFRSTLWTGEHLQITLMCIGKGESIGLERHTNLDHWNMAVSYYK